MFKIFQVWFNPIKRIKRLHLRYVIPQIASGRLIVRIFLDSGEQEIMKCDCPGCSDNNVGNIITGSIGAIREHALNHEIVEIQDELERLSHLDLGSLLEELIRCSKDTLQIFQNHVEHGSTLERFILEALDRLEERIPSN